MPWRRPLWLAASSALVSLVDDQRQQVLARVGTAVEELRREKSICAHIIGSGDLLIIPDA